MKIQDRIKAIEGVEDVDWDGSQNRLVTYYSGSLDKVKILVADAIAKAGLQWSIEKITYIS